MDMTAFKGAMDGVSYVRTALSALLREKNEMAVRERVLEVIGRVDSIQTALFDAREDAFRVQNERDALQRRLRDFEDWKETANGYRLQRTAGGARVYRSLDDPDLLMCPACFDQKSLMPLQELARGSFECPKASCKAGFTVEVIEQPIDTGDPIIGNILDR